MYYIASTNVSISGMQMYEHVDEIVVAFEDITMTCNINQIPKHHFSFGKHLRHGWNLVERGCTTKCRTNSIDECTM